MRSLVDHQWPSGWRLAGVRQRYARLLTPAAWRRPFTGQTQTNIDTHSLARSAGDAIGRAVRTLLALSALGLLSGCMDDGYDGSVTESGDAAVVVNEQGRAIYQSSCASCHGLEGNGTSVGSSLVACATCSSVDVLADEIERTMPVANVSSCVGDCASNVAEYIMQAFNGGSATVSALSIEGVTAEPYSATLRRATLLMLGRLPSQSELNRVRLEGEDGLSAVLDEVMNEDAFYEYLMTVFNEQFLTDKYLSSNLTQGGINLLDADDFPNRKWYNDQYPNDEQSSLRSCLRTEANDAVAREPLELVRYAAMTEQPHTLFVTADYMMVNWYSQQVYDAELVDGAASFRQLDEPVCAEVEAYEEDGVLVPASGERIYYDPTDFKPARITHDTEYAIGGYPHAGVLTSPMFLNRYPTTYTNRNRHRSRIFYDYFLDIDILAIEGDRPEDGVGSGIANPTLLDPACYGCHQVMDPVASAFQHWTDNGRYIVTGPSSRNSWDSSDIEAPGFNGKTLPISGSGGYFRNMLQWLGQETAADPNFAWATVRTLYQGMMATNLLAAPGSEGSDADLKAYNDQRKVINTIATNMVNDGWRIKTAVKGILMSPYFRAAAVDQSIHATSSQFGASRFLSPEQMQNKLNAVIGFGWDEFRYESNRIMYGGMDSDSIVEMIREPSGLMIAIQDRMASEMACRAVAYDFTKTVSERVLFPNVAVDTMPQDMDGNAIDSSAQRIRENIAYLFWTFFGEEVSADHAEVEAAYQLFEATWLQGRSLLASDEQMEPSMGNWLEWECRARWQRNAEGRSDGNLPEEQRIDDDPDYVIRAWIAVITYLMTDYRFVYE